MARAVARSRQPVQPRGIRTRTALLRAGAAEFSARGYAATTAKTVAAAARVATGSFYQYFESKDALLRELVAARHSDAEARTFAILDAAPLAIAPESAAIRAEAGARLRKIVEAVIGQHRDDPGFHAVFTERRHADPELDAILGEYEHRLVKGVARLLDRLGFAGDATATAFVLNSMLEGSVHAHVLGRPVVSDTRFTAALVDSMVRVAHLDP